MQNKLFESKIVVITSATKTQYLASTLLDNAGGTTAIEAKGTPDFSYPAPKASSYKDNGFSTTEKTEDFDTTVQGEYVTYASAYTFDTATGKYSLTNPVTAKYSDVYASLAGKYLASTSYWIIYAFTSSSSGIASSNIDYIVKCVEAPYSVTTSVTFKYNDLVSNRFSYDSYSKSDKGFSNDLTLAEMDSTNQIEYITYASSYTFDEATGTYNLVNPITDLYSNVYNNLAGKYVSGQTCVTANSNPISSNNILPTLLANNIATPLRTNVSMCYISSTSTPNATTSLNSIFKIATAEYDTSKTVAFNYYKSNDNNNYDASSSGMWSAQDDYGTSYYYRGIVTDNNVIFGGYCWKVIRINGNETTRMIYNGTPTSGQCTATGTDTQIGTSAFNTNYNDNAYVGYMYGTAGSSTYDATHANTNSSTIKTAIDAWYNTNLSSYADKISDTEFCNDRSIASSPATWNSSDTALGYGTNITYYGAFNRIVNNNTPTLTCLNKHDRFTVDDTGVGNGDLTYPVSLITSDEVAVAGGKVGTSNSYYYLYTGNSYWTVSASRFLTRTRAGSLCILVVT
jgi:hypothetical protein